MQYIPPYQQIAEHYREQLRQGVLHEGDQLPTTRTISAEWGVSRVTVGKALNALRSEGLIVTQGRNGTRVAFNDRVRTALAAPIVLAELTSVGVEMARSLGVQPGISLLLLQVASPTGGNDVLQESPQPLQYRSG